jgi:hypothetical protein
MPRTGLDDISDEALGREIFALWHHYFITNVPFTMNGNPVDQITDEQLEAILPTFRGIARVAAFNQDTDNESLAGVEKGIRLCGSGNFNRGGRMFRAYFERLDEAKTGRRRQSAIASNPRPDYLQSVLIDLVRKKPNVSRGEAIEELRRLEALPDNDPGRHHPKIERVAEGRVEWREPNNPAASAPLSNIKYRLRNARSFVNKEPQLL